LRDLLVTIAHRAYALGLVPGVSGNLSVRVPGEAAVIIKATGKSLGDMTSADTLVIDLEGRIRGRGARARRSLQPSKEWPFHTAIYRCRPDVGAVVHLHPPHAVAFAAMQALPPMLTGAARTFLGGKTALIPPAPSGSRELADLVGEAFRDPAIQAAILAEHGTITVGPDLYAAFYMSEYLEDAARTACLVRQLHGERR
jgi:ribulose-5-phosphate 4-epimerase/fuculose-1-phosphate aldolase